MPSIGQTWVLASIGAVVEMGVLSTLKRLRMESTERGFRLKIKNCGSSNTLTLKGTGSIRIFLILVLVIFLVYFVIFHCQKQRILKESMKLHWDFCK
jgi:hypothetical protein